MKGVLVSVFRLQTFFFCFFQLILILLSVYRDVTRAFVFVLVNRAKMGVSYHAKPGYRRAVHHGRQRVFEWCSGTKHWVVEQKS